MHADSYKLYEQAFFIKNPVDKEKLFSELINQCGDHAYNFALRLCGNESDANDLVQAAFLKAFENISKYDPSKPFQPWLNRILHNLFVDYTKRYENRNIVSFDKTINDEEDRLESTLADTSPTPLENLSQQELEQVVKKALETLDVEYRSAVILSDMEGKSYEEISEIMNCPIGTVRSRIHRGRQLLKKELEPYLGNFLDTDTKYESTR